MTMLSDAYNIVIDNASWADAVYAKELKQDNIAPNQTFVLVKDSLQALSLFGSNTFKEMTYDVEIQIWYSTHSLLDYDDVEIKLMKALENSGWRTQSIRGRVPDPDTQQDFQTIYVSKTKEIN